MEIYRDFNIEYNPPPIPIRVADWQYSHVGYDGPEDNRCGFGPTVESVKRDIDNYYMEKDYETLETKGLSEST